MDIIVNERHIEVVTKMTIKRLYMYVVHIVYMCNICVHVYIWVIFPRTGKMSNGLIF